MMLGMLAHALRAGNARKVTHDIMGGKPGLPQAKLQNHEFFMIATGVHENLAEGVFFVPF
jgi:hypothetical protein